MQNKLVHAVFGTMFLASGLMSAWLWYVHFHAPDIDCAAMVADITIFDHGKPLGTAKNLDLEPAEHGCAIADGEP